MFIVFAIQIIPQEFANTACTLLQYQRKLSDHLHDDMIKPQGLEQDSL